MYYNRLESSVSTMMFCAIKCVAMSTVTEVRIRETHERPQALAQPFCPCEESHRVLRGVCFSPSRLGSLSSPSSSSSSSLSSSSSSSQAARSAGCGSSSVLQPFAVSPDPQKSNNSSASDRERIFLFIYFLNPHACI